MAVHAETPIVSGVSDVSNDLNEAVTDTLARLQALPRHSPQRARLRDEVICNCAPLARRMAMRFQHRGEELDDLAQVATLGLIKAVDRFDCAKGVPFTHYAVPTMLGELKRYFRDRAWMMRVHRSLQELHLEIGRAIPYLSQRLQRTPQVADIAEYLEVDDAEVLRGMECSVAYAAGSLNAPTRSGEPEAEVAEFVGEEDHDLELVPDRHALRQALSTLPARDRKILALRFIDNLTQAEIANRIGVSQMHVSRLLARSFARLREAMLADGP